jgi:hypothetical protein
MDEKDVIDKMIIRGDPFDCRENTSEEERRVKRVWQPKNQIDTLILPNQQNNNTINQEMEYSFDGYVKEILASTVFGASIPTQPPDKEFDTPELYQDKLNYQQAVLGSKRFKDEILMPLLESVSERLESTVSEPLYNALLKAPRLVAEKTKTANEPSEWSSFVLKNSLIKLRFIIPRGNVEDYSIRVTPSEAEYIKALHNLFHLKKYIVVALFASLKDQKIENYTQAWNVLATPDYAEKPIKDWEDLTFIPFVDNILSLWKVVEFFKKNQ